MKDYPLNYKINNKKQIHYNNKLIIQNLITNKFPLKVLKVK